MPNTTVAHRRDFQGVDFEGDWVAVCETHGTMVGCKSRTRAEHCADFPRMFCDACRDAEDTTVS
jgi:hypothetical protein